MARNFVSQQIEDLSLNNVTKISQEELDVDLFTTHDLRQIIFFRTKKDFVNITFNILSKIFTFNKAYFLFLENNGMDQELEKLFTKSVDILSSVENQVKLVCLTIQKFCQNNPSQYNFKYCITAVCITLEAVEKIIQILLNIIENPREVINITNQISLQNSRLKFLQKEIVNSLKSDSQDIFYKPPTDKDWQLINSALQYDSSSFKGFKERYKDLVSTLMIAQVSYMECSQESKILKKTLLLIYNFISYKIKASKIKDNYPSTIGNLQNMKVKELITMMCITENKYLSPLVRISNPSIIINKVIYIPKLLKPLTIKKLEKSLSSKLQIKKISNETNYFEDKKMYIPSKHVSVRILSNESIYPLNISPLCLLRSIFGINQQKAKMEKILIHIHGGGFVGMSSEGHENYLRKWTIQCGFVTFSIDYRLAPTNTFPDNLDDIVQAYYWILNYCSEYFEILPKVVILTGDSAGGNLVLSLTYLTIRMGLRIPDGILLSYPALNLSLRSFTPSLLGSLDDFLMRYNILEICVNSYLRDTEIASCPYVSPCNIPDDDLKLFPLVRIMIGGKDPLRDECIKFVLRLIKNGVDVKGKIYRLMPHGFLNFDNFIGLKDTGICTNHAIEFFNDMITLIYFKSGRMNIL